MNIKVYEILQKTLQKLLCEIENSETVNEKLEKLCHVAGFIKPEVVATALQLMETGKVRHLMVKNSENTVKKSKNRRKFENFTVKSEFTREDELMTWRSRKMKKKVEKLEEIDEKPSFVEVENSKKREKLNFLYPSVHYCTCKYFQLAVLQLHSDWICLHLLAYYFSKTFRKIDTIDCNPTITEIVRKILIRCVIADCETEK